MSKKMFTGDHFLILINSLLHFDHKEKFYADHFFDLLICIKPERQKRPLHVLIIISSFFFLFISTST